MYTLNAYRRWASVAALVLYVCFGHVARAQVPPQWSVDQVREAFLAAGYSLDGATSWDWTQPPVTTFQIRDAGGEHVVMVVVYPSANAADTALFQAEAHDEAPKACQLATDQIGPHLVSGFGPSVWSGNVALVETTRRN